MRIPDFRVGGIRVPVVLAFLGCLPVATPAGSAQPVAPASSSPVAESRPDALSVDEAVALALRRNPRRLAAVREIAAARAGARAERALANPSLAFTPGLTSPAGSDEELLFQQPLELNGGRSARAAVASAQLRRTEAEAVAELQGLVLETKTAYYELALAQELRALSQEVLRTAEAFHEGVRRQAAEGLRPEIDPVQTEIELARARQQLTVAESRVAAARAALNTLIGRDASEPVSARPLLAAGEATANGLPGPRNVEQLVEQALSARPEIAAEVAEHEALRQQARLVRAEGRPDLVLQFRAERITRGIDETGIGLGISLPFLDWGSRRNRLRQVEAAVEAQEARLEAIRAQVRREVVQAVARRDAAAGIVRQYRQGVLDRARRLLDASLRGLQLGAPGTTLLTVLEAQRTYRGIVTEYATALADYAQAQAELERALGAAPASEALAASPDSRTPR